MCSISTMEICLYMSICRSCQCFVIVLYKTRPWCKLFECSAKVTRGDVDAIVAQWNHHILSHHGTSWAELVRFGYFARQDIQLQSFQQNIGNVNLYYDLRGTNVEAIEKNLWNLQMGPSVIMVLGSLTLPRSHQNPTTPSTHRFRSLTHLLSST